MIFFKKQITIVSSFFINKSYFLYNIVQKHLKHKKKKKKHIEKYLQVHKYCNGQ
jgi:hypothetical protein